mmetsp:Transcript_12465/g.43631  ORF Transcript_12465/g.43631 Transcript_12465/m.43631 type:complete len:206 (+) Transcript_12465:447-1064(+)
MRSRLAKLVRLICCDRYAEYEWKVTMTSMSMAPATTLPDCCDSMASAASRTTMPTIVGTTANDESHSVVSNVEPANVHRTTLTKGCQNTTNACWLREAAHEGKITARNGDHMPRLQSGAALASTTEGAPMQPTTCPTTSPRKMCCISTPSTHKLHSRRDGARLPNATAATKAHNANDKTPNTTHPALQPSAMARIGARQRLSMSR